MQGRLTDSRLSDSKLTVSTLSNSNSRLSDSLLTNSVYMNNSQSSYSLLPDHGYVFLTILPEDVLFYLTEFLKIQHIKKLSQLGKYFYQLSRANQLWRNRFEAYFPNKYNVIYALGKDGKIKLQSVNWNKTFIKKYTALKKQHELSVREMNLISLIMEERHKELLNSDLGPDDFATYPILFDCFENRRGNPSVAHAVYQAVEKKFQEKPTNQQDAAQRTLVHWALMCNETRDVFVKLVDSKNVNIANKMGNTPLHLAVLLNRPDVIDDLIKKGADVNKFNQANMTPLMLAIEQGHLHLVQYLLESSKANKKILDVNLANKKGMTPLHLAATQGSDAIFNYLLRQQATIVVTDGNLCDCTPNNITNSDGCTPLLVAAKHGSLNIVKSILDKRFIFMGDIDKRIIKSAIDNEGRSALQLAIENGHFDVAKYLINEHQFNVQEALIATVACVHKKAKYDLMRQTDEKCKNAPQFNKAYDDFTQYLIKDKNEKITSKIAITLCNVMCQRAAEYRDRDIELCEAYHNTSSKETKQALLNQMGMSNDTFQLIQYLLNNHIAVFAGLLKEHHFMSRLGDMPVLSYLFCMALKRKDDNLVYQLIESGLITQNMEQWDKDFPYPSSPLQAAIGYGSVYACTLLLKDGTPYYESILDDAVQYVLNNQDDKSVQMVTSFLHQYIIDHAIHGRDNNILSGSLISMFSVFMSNVTNTNSQVVTRDDNITAAKKLMAVLCGEARTDELKIYEQTSFTRGDLAKIYKAVQPLIERIRVQEKRVTETCVAEEHVNETGDESSNKLKPF